MKYIFTQLEEDIKNFYESLSIIKPSELDMIHISRAFDIWVEFEPEKSEFFDIEGMLTICIDKRLNRQKRWQEFGHEFCHFVKHIGSQDKLRKCFKDLQEYQANSFMYHFCVPTFMLLDMNIANYHNIHDGIYIVAETFNVTPEFAKRRLEMFRDQMLQAHLDKKFIEDIKDTAIVRYSKYMKTKTRKFPSHTDDIVALAIARKKEKEGALS